MVSMLQEIFLYSCPLISILIVKIQYLYQRWATLARSGRKAVEHAERREEIEDVYAGKMRW